MANGSEDIKLGMVARYLDEEASGLDDSIRPGLAVRYRRASAVLSLEQDPAPALEILVEEEMDARHQITHYQARLERIKVYQRNLKTLKD